MMPASKAEVLGRLDAIADRVRCERMLGNGHPRGKVAVHLGTCGTSAGALKLMDCLSEEFSRRGIEDILLTGTGCAGQCVREPMITVEMAGHLPVKYANLDKEKLLRILEEHILGGRVVRDYALVAGSERTWDAADAPQEVAGPELEGIPLVRESDFYGDQVLIAMRNRGRINPDSIEDYILYGGYRALAKGLFDMAPSEIIDEMKRSGLRGRGGAGFPTGLKWEFCANARGDFKFVLCNGDEGDPGAFMDRCILESDPHAVVEGMALAGRAIGARYGYVYVRAEYPLAVEKLTRAIEQAREHGFLGQEVMGTDYAFDVNIYQGAGAFVCGEETALMRSIEGKRGTPRPRPPFPAQKGLWDLPSTLNNVETLANVPQIILNGAEWYSQLGTEKSKGTKVFALAGSVKNIGLVEVPMGIELGTIVHKIGGGMRGGKRFKAIQLGGPSGGCLPSSLLNTSVDYESIGQTGAIMGSGGMIVMDESACMVDIARFFLAFTAEESCGKCTPCRVGTRVLLKKLEDICAGRGQEEDIELLEDLSREIISSALCGLGQTAPNPVLTTIRYFRDEYEAHIRKKQCPALVCSGIISSPCQYTCPLGTDVPAYVALIAKGEFGSAAELVRRTNPLPHVCSRVCHRPCEEVCRAGEGGDPVAIRALKRAVFDYERKHPGATAPPRVVPQYEKVAIVGSGPAGLTAAHHLARGGYEVTVFEAEQVAGGMLALCIPDYRLPSETLQMDVENIKAAGVDIRTNTAVGRDVTVDQLFEQGYKAVFVATGAYRNLKLGVEGEDVEGVVDVIEFLKAVKRGEAKAPGRRVGVIGGGNAAIDAARTAHFLGSDVTIIYRRTRAEMPADASEIDEALHEGVKLHYLAAPKRVLARDGKVCGVECIRMELGDLDASGRRRPVPIEGSEFTVELDVLIPAIGQQPDLSFLPGDDGLKVTKWNTIEVDEETYMTGRPGVFAAGDVVTGPATVTNAMKAGRIAARSIHQYLRGQPVERHYEVMKPQVYVPMVELAENEEIPSARPEMPALAVEERRGFAEVELGLTEEQARKEGRRCLRCDLLEREVGEEQEEAEEARVSSAG